MQFLLINSERYNEDNDCDELNQMLWNTFCHTHWNCIIVKNVNSVGKSRDQGMWLNKAIYLGLIEKS